MMTVSNTIFFFTTQYNCPIISSWPSNKRKFRRWLVNIELLLYFPVKAKSRLYALVYDYFEKNI